MFRWLIAAIAAGCSSGWVVVSVAGRWWDAPPAWFVVAVVFLPVLWCAAAAPWLLAWAVHPRGVGAPVGLTLHLLAAAASFSGPAHSTPSGDSVRVMWWNVQRLWGAPKASACVSTELAAADPHIFVLGEVTAADAAVLGDPLGAHCVHAPYRAAEHSGLAVCVRRGVTVVHSGGQPYVDSDPWQYLAAELAWRDTVFNVLAVHLTPYAFSLRRPTDVNAAAQLGESVQRSQSDQAAALVARLQKLKDPTLVVGDFNSTRDAALHVALRRLLVDTWSVAGRGRGATAFLWGKIPLRVDFQYATEDLRPAHVAVLRVDCSDHRPVVLDMVPHGPTDPASARR